ncbi:hypothetical protein JB92DRAFT_511256 [Gautieria morchelliformis]|nr:hypothetical protein JB92DRAFT_511256 [Gautieria morchelliformis]
MVANAEPEDVKPKLNLVIVFNERSIRLQVRANTHFKKIFDTAYTKFNQAPGTIRFTYEGKRIQAADSPLDYEMEDGDQIDAQVEQVGGTYRWRQSGLA